MRPDLAYVYPAGATPHSLAPAKIRRPRTCPCRSHRRATPVCMADDHRQWFGLKTWFRRDEKIPTDVVAERDQEPQNSADANGMSRADNIGKGTSSDREPDKPVDRGFRWPWQKDDDSGEDELVKEVRRVSHSDSKPGSFGRRREDEPKIDNETDKTSLQERWRRIVDIIAPGFSKEKEDTEGEEGAKGTVVARSESQGQDGVERDSVPRDEVRLKSRSRGSTRKSSITELYQPPTGQPKPNEQESWFKLPWKKDAVQETEAEETKDQSVEQASQAGEDEVEIEPEQDELGTSSSQKEVPDDSMLETEVLREESDVEAQPKKSVEQKKRETAVALRTTKASSPRGPFLDFVPVPQRDVAAIRLIFGSETFFATETLSAPGGLIFRGNLRGEPKATVAKLEQQLASRLGDKYTLCLAEGEEDLRPVVVVVPTARDKRPASPRQKFMALVLALMTASTCLGRGLFAIVLKPSIHALHGPPLRDHFLYPLFGSASSTSLAIAAAIGIIIILSQLVQRMVGSRYKTRVAIPFLLPSYQLGSFGAVVQVASPTPTRAALFDIALSGAATMVCLSITCLLLGLRMSTSFSDVIPVPMSLVSNSVVMGFLTQQVPDGKILIDYGRSLIGLHPLAVIGANCLTIAALNLLPIRQLDGGRIISALYGRRTAVHASRVTVLFLLLASSKSPYFIVFLAAITFGPWHPDRPSRNELTEPDGLRTIVGYLFMLLMIGVLLPFPASKFFGTV